MKQTETAVPTLREAVRYALRLVTIVRPYWGRVTQGILLGLVIGIFGMVTPYLTKMFIDDVYPSGDLNLMHVLVIGVVVVSLASSVMGAVRTYYAQAISARLSTAIGLMFFNHLQHLPVRFFDEHRVGEMMSRFGDVRGALSAVTGAFQTIIVNGTYLILVPPLLLSLNWKLTIVALVSMPFTTGISTASGRLLRKYWKRNAEQSAELNAQQVEVLSQIRALKSLAVEHHIYRATSKQAEEVLRTQLRANAFSTLIGLLNGLLNVAGTAVFTWYAWTLILRGDLSLGSFIAFSAYLGYLTGPVNRFAGLFNGFQQTAVSFARAFEYLDAKPEQDPSAVFSNRATLTRRLGGDITLTNVSFGYSPDRPVLHNITVAIPRGSVTAVVGASGAGKSSLLRLLCRFADADNGQITVDGKPIQHYELSELRQQVTVVWQDFSLLRGTIWENLTIGLSDVPREQVDDAIRICRLDGLLAELPDGYATAVAEWGATLSGGQRQRLAICRALIRDTPILLLDEATSQIDTQTEEAMLRELFVRLRGRTVVLVTHRLATATFADRICLLDKGHLVAAGTHRELLAESALYREMVTTAGAPDEPRHLRVL